MHAWLKFEGHSSKNEAATPLRSSKLKWAWRAQFLSHNLQILWKFIFFESLQMIVKPSLAISNSIEFGKKWSSPPSMCKGVLALGYESACPGLRKNFRPLSMPWEALSIPRSPFSPAKTSILEWNVPLAVWKVCLQFCHNLDTYFPTLQNVYSAFCCRKLYFSWEEQTTMFYF